MNVVLLIIRTLGKSYVPPIYRLGGRWGEWVGCQPTHPPLFHLYSKKNIKKTLTLQNGNVVKSKKNPHVKNVKIQKSLHTTKIRTQFLLREINQPSGRNGRDVSSDSNEKPRPSSNAK